jgi:hypothetical protein
MILSFWKEYGQFITSLTLLMLFISVCNQGAESRGMRQVASHLEFDTRLRSIGR